MHRIHLGVCSLLLPRIPHHYAYPVPGENLGLSLLTTQLGLLADEFPEA